MPARLDLADVSTPDSPSALCNTPATRSIGRTTTAASGPGMAQMVRTGFSGSGVRWAGLAIALVASACDGDQSSLRQPSPPASRPASQAVEVAQPSQSPSPARAPSGSDRMARALMGQAAPIVGRLPTVVRTRQAPVTDAQVTLGRQLYFETRLSKNHDLSCNSCHDLGSYGVDIRVAGGKTSKGHRGALGGRNSPTVYNAALHMAQFWDGRAADVEAQAKGPVLNPVEMAMPSEEATVAVLQSIPGYQALFETAFPDDKQPLTYNNMARAIGAFERKLITPAPFDAFIAGDPAALNAKQQQGLAVFLQAGCTACHSGPALGGAMYQKLGLLKPYPTQDIGRAEVTGNDADKYFFKVPSLRNIAKTAPYLHDGSIATLGEMVDVMAEYQTARGKLRPAERDALVAFLGSLTGTLPTDYIKPPAPLAAGPKTPAPDPN